ncbi:MAG: ribosome biogenesis GTPase Der, partial [Sphaerochaetaceae bacterium]|nr:ribosome biogenesis GTPase Der [Sphaerochaetaceae bacterium]
KNGENIGKLLDTVWEVHCEMQKRVDTSVLNAAVARWGEKYQPPRGELGHYKVYYGTQISAAPVKFLFFVNHTKDFPPAYLQYLKNCIRKDLGFTMVPVEIDLRERRRNPSLHDKPKQVVSLTAIKKHAAEKAVKARSGGRAKAKARPVKPGNKASYGKALKRQSKIQKNAGQMQQHLQKKHGR